MADEILEKMRGQYEHRFRNDQKLKRIRKKLQNGANQAAAQEYAVAAGEILSDVLKENVTADLFGETMPDAATLAGLIIPMMEQNYTHVVSAASASQKYMNSEGNLGMKPIEPEFDRNAAMNIVGRMANYDSFEDAEWLMDEPIRTNSQHIADESLRENAEFQYRSGLKPKIVRTCESDACEWCQMLEGEYDIDEITGKDDPVYQRHNNCQCEITFVPGEGRAENITDQMVNLGDIDDRIAKSREEAERWRKEQLANQSNRIIESENSANDVGERQRGYAYQLHPGDVAVHTPEWYIQSSEWESRFNSLDVNKDCREQIVYLSKQAVLDNKNATTESMYLVNGKDGSKVASIDLPEEKHSGYVQYTDDFKNALNLAKEEKLDIIAIHNHPNGLPPSVDDFRKAYENGYSLGIIPGNNGQVYSYSNKTVPLDEDLCEEIHSQISMLLELGVDPDDAFQSIYSKYKLSYNILEEANNE